MLSEFAKSQPQAAYALFCFGEQNKIWLLFTNHTRNERPNETGYDIVQNVLQPAIIGNTTSEKERELYSLPV